MNTDIAKRLVNALVRNDNFINSSNSESVIKKLVVYEFLLEKGYTKSFIAELFNMAASSIVHYKKIISTLKGVEYYKYMFYVRSVWFTLDMKFVMSYNGWNIYTNGVFFYPILISLDNETLLSIISDEFFEFPSVEAVGYFVNGFNVGMNLRKCNN
mgnify:CR=1 FL=1